MRFKKYSFVTQVIVLVMFVSLVFMFGCKKKIPVAEKTLEIGFIGNLGSPNGLDSLHDQELLAELDNKKGGIEVGDERYNIQIIAYDSGGKQSQAVAAVNRLIFEDKVKFIIHDGMSFEGAWLKTTDENKVIVTGLSFAWLDLMPDRKYTYHAMAMHSNGIVAVGWLCKNYPDKIKNVVLATPDNQMGHMTERVLTPMWNKFGVKPKWLFFPAESQDQSALGTKVKRLNPGVFSSAAGNPIVDGLIIKAAYQSGWRGLLFSNGSVPAQLLATVAPWEALEGYISTGWPHEFDPPSTKAAKEYRDAWEAKFGKWEGQDGMSAFYISLKTAIQKAGTLDPDKIVEVIFNGMEFEGPCGKYQMISRPDLGNNRTIDSVVTTTIKQIKNGKTVLVETLSLDDAKAYLKKAYSK